MRGTTPIVAALFWAAASPVKGQDISVSGYVGTQTLHFTQDGLGADTINRLNAEIQARGALTDTLSFELRLFGSTPLNGQGGDYFDPRVAKLTWQAGNWQADLGYDTVYWGVAESQNVVNIINQREQILDLQGDLALGQPMFALRYFGPSWSIEGYVMPQFRELEYGIDGRRWGFGFPVDQSAATFESPDGDDHVDYALRFAGSVGNLEYGLSAFDGTLRRPVLVLDTTAGTLSPHYVQGKQYGIDLQYTAGATLFKFEGIHVNPDSSAAYEAAVYGIENVLGDVFGNGWETTVFAEHNWDSRGVSGPAIFQNDLFLGARINFANLLDSQLTVGAMYDLDNGGLLGSVEFDTRLTDQVSLNAEYTFVSADNPDDTLFSASGFDQLKVQLEWNF